MAHTSSRELLFHHLGFLYYGSQGPYFAEISQQWWQSIFHDWAAHTIVEKWDWVWVNITQMCTYAHTHTHKNKYWNPDTSIDTAKLLEK